MLKGAPYQRTHRGRKCRIVKYRTLPLLLLAVLAMFQMAESVGAGQIRHVIVIAMENKDASRIYGNSRQAPYINKHLLPKAARARNFRDILPLSVPSGPHYILMQAARRKFSDYTFASNEDPSATHSTASLNHFIRQLDQSAWPTKPTWMAYQQGLNANTGACPVVSSGRYVAKHNPFVYFQDIAGNPPSMTNVYCAEHHKPLSALDDDIAANTLANYVFITPDQCHNMHDRCNAPSRIRAGDRWLEKWMPKLMFWADLNDAVIFIIWDEGKKTRRIPFLALGPGVRKGFASDVEMDHRSYVRSLSEIFETPLLPAIGDAKNFKSLFLPGAYP